MTILYKTSLQTDSLAFLKSIKSWCTASFYSHFFVSTWRIQNICTVVDVLCRHGLVCERKYLVHFHFYYNFKKQSHLRWPTPFWCYRARDREREPVRVPGETDRALDQQVAPPKQQRHWKVKDPFWNTVELHLFGLRLSGTLIIWIGLTRRVNLSRILPN
jgi:hypothetical protein